MKTNLLLVLFSLSLATSLMTSGCQKDEPQQPGCTFETPVFLLGSKEFVPDSSINVERFNFLWIDDIEAKWLEINMMQPDGAQLFIRILNFENGTDGDCLDLKTYQTQSSSNYCTISELNGNTVCEQSEIGYRTVDGTYYYGTGSITINSCDAETDKVSGSIIASFDNAAIGELSGTFSGLCFSVE